MNCLIIAAHGSRKKQSNDEVAKLTAKLASKLKNRFDRVDHAFLQISDPLLDKTLDQLVKEGAHKIVVFPFFISSGSHILTDIPGLVAEKKKAFPNVDFILTHHLGSLETIADVIADEVKTYIE